MIHHIYRRAKSIQLADYTLLPLKGYIPSNILGLHIPARQPSTFISAPELHPSISILTNMIVYERSSPPESMPSALHNTPIIPDL
jgi:hypothetical protein